jgi:hypothetical protein
MMPRQLGIIVYLLTTVLTLDAKAAPRRDLPTEGVISNPDWIKKPDGDDVSRFYPSLASFLSISGRARINGAVTDLGALIDCTTLSETPAGFGFGQASIQMSAMFRMKPRTLDGEPVGGARVTVPLNFLPAADSDVAEPDQTQPSPSPKALALGRRLAAESMDTAQITTMIKTSVQRMRDNYAAEGLTHEQQLAIDEFEKALIASTPLRVERMARFYAGSISEPELAEIVTFLGRPAGKQWVAQSAQAQLVEIKTAQSLQSVITKDAKAHICSQIACLPRDMPAPAKP